MLRTLTLFLLFPFIGFSQEHKLLTEDYNFLATDGEINKLHQSNDTLYELHCYIDQPCQPVPETHSRIISSQQIKDFTILKIEQLDTIPLTTVPYPATRYSVGVFKNIDNKQLGYLSLISGLTKQQIDTFRIDTNLLNDMFFFTSYSDSYLKELSALKKVTTKSQVLEIMDVIKSNQFKLLVDKYRKTKTGDMYGSGFSAEILNRACIEKGYNPIGAGRIINKLE